jgi:hypothetical protein
MTLFVGLDVSVKKTAVCVVDDGGSQSQMPDESSAVTVVAGAGSPQPILGRCLERGHLNRLSRRFMCQRVLELLSPPGLTTKYNPR